jgi:type I restriction enzyme S subunit
VKFRFLGHEPVEMVESGMGMIPKGWEMVDIKDISCLISRGISPSYDIASEDLVINQKCIRNNRLSLDEARRHTTKVSNEKRVRFGDILINSTGVGTLGRIAQVYQDIPNCTVDSHVTIVRPNRKVDIDFFGLQMISLQSHFEGLGVGTTGQTELGREKVATTKFLLPQLDLQEKFALLVSPMRKNAIQMLQKNANLRRTRDLLLPKLISGEIDVSSWLSDEEKEQEEIVVGEMKGAPMEPAQTIDVAAMQQRMLWE